MVDKVVGILYFTQPYSLFVSFALGDPLRMLKSLLLSLACLLASESALAQHFLYQCRGQTQSHDWIFNGTYSKTFRYPGPVAIVRKPRGGKARLTYQVAASDLEMKEYPARMIIDLKLQVYGTYFKINFEKETGEHTVVFGPEGISGSSIYHVQCKISEEAESTIRKYDQCFENWGACIAFQDRYDRIPFLSEKDEFWGPDIGEVEKPSTTKCMREGYTRQQCKQMRR